jgi:uncharacterized protein (TIGR03000 family)
MHHTRAVLRGGLAALALLALTPILVSQDKDKGQTAQLTIKVPAGAVVEIEGVKTKQTGEIRRFVSPALAPGKNYFYTVKVTYKDADGKDVTEEKVAKVTAGQDSEIDLRPAVAKVEEKPRPKLDVPYVPTAHEVVEKMLELAKVTKDDVVYDLGCGDGRIVVAAAKNFGCKAVGIDIDPVRVKEARENVKKNKVEGLVEIREGNALEVKDLGKASVVTLYLYPHINLKLMPQLKKDLKPGSRVVSHDFDMGDWKADKEISVKSSRISPHTVYLWNIGEASVKKERPTLDVPYVPTPNDVVEKMLAMAQVTKDDVVYDLGCGDGRIVVAAAKKFGCKAVGIDLDPERVKEARENVKKNKVEDLVEIREGNALDVKDLGKANVVTLYLLNSVNLKLRPQLQQDLKKGSRVVSHDFSMGDWEPKQKVTLDSKDDGNSHDVYLWVIGEEAKKEEKKEEVKEEKRTPDVIYVPTPNKVVERMLELAKVKKDDIVWDLGCGDARIPVTAAKKYGCKAVGYDIDPKRIEESNANVKKNQMEQLVKIEKKDIFTLDLSQANVITLYLLPSLNVKLIPQLEKLKPGSRIVSHDFDMEGVKPDTVEEIEAEDDNGFKRVHKVYLWTVPLKKEEPERRPDVIYVPTPQPVVDRMLELAKVTKDDIVYDLGCGDGRIPVTAAKKYGAKAWGFDVDPDRISDSNKNVEKNKVGSLVTIEKKDIFTLDLSKVNVVTLYLLPSLNVKLIPQLEKLKDGSRIVSHDFRMEGVKPDKEEELECEDDNGVKRTHRIFLWTTPLKKDK